MVRQPLYPVEQGDVDNAIGWLDDHWRGGVFVPDELMPLVAVGAPRSLLLKLPARRGTTFRAR